MNIFQTAPAISIFLTLFYKFIRLGIVRLPLLRTRRWRRGLPLVILVKSDNFGYQGQNLKILGITGPIWKLWLSYPKSENLGSHRQNYSSSLSNISYQQAKRQRKERKIIWISKFCWHAPGTSSTHSSTLQQLKMLTKWKFAQKLDSALFVSP